MSLQQIRDDEADARRECDLAERRYVEARNDLAECTERFQYAWGEKNRAEKVCDEAEDEYRAAFKAAHGCDLPGGEAERLARRVRTSMTLSERLQ